MKRSLIALIFVTLAALLGGCLDSQEVEVDPFHNISCPGTFEDCQQCGRPPAGVFVCPSPGIAGRCQFEPRGCFDCLAQNGQSKAKWQIVHVACDDFPEFRPDAGADAH